jgi:hypothetical protein
MARPMYWPSPGRATGVASNRAPRAAVDFWGVLGGAGRVADPLDPEFGYRQPKAPLNASRANLQSAARSAWVADRSP